MDDFKWESMDKRWLEKERIDRLREGKRGEILTFVEISNWTPEQVRFLSLALKYGWNLIVKVVTDENKRKRVYLERAVEL